jgi:tRNA(Ile)-lysidine synthase TilS/MesJ
METKRVFEVKKGRAWCESVVITDPVEVYKFLAEELIAKKINACSYIRSIKRTNLYNGYQKIVISYDYGGRAVYTIRA